MLDGARRHHLSVKHSTAREGAVEDAAMPICPFHHGGNRKRFANCRSGIFSHVAGGLAR